jgi:WD40 repeat protein
MAKRHLKMLEGHEDEINIVIAATLPSLAALAPISAELDASSKHLASSVIISGSRDNVIRVWDLREGYLLYELVGHTKAVYGLSLALSNDPFRSASGKLVKKGTPILVSCGEDVTVRFWNLETKELLATGKRWHKGCIRAVCCQSMKCSVAKSSTRFRNVVVSCGWDKSIRMHDMDDCLKHANDCCSIS